VELEGQIGKGQHPTQSLEGEEWNFSRQDAKAARKTFENLRVPAEWFLYFGAGDVVN